MIGILGAILFTVTPDTVRTFRDATRSGGARWASHEVHLRKPIKEFLGPESEQLSLTVRLSIDHGVEPRDEIRVMREARDAGEILPLILGGELVGDYVLGGINESWTRVGPDGRILDATVEVSLEEYQ